MTELDNALKPCWEKIFKESLDKAEEPHGAKASLGVNLSSAKRAADRGKIIKTRLKAAQRNTVLNELPRTCLASFQIRSLQLEPPLNHTAPGVKMSLRATSPVSDDSRSHK